MYICGYHVRCMNEGKKCTECRYQQVTNNKDYLDDVFNIWPQGKEAATVPECTCLIGLR